MLNLSFLKSFKFILPSYLRFQCFTIYILFISTVIIYTLYIYYVFEKLKLPFNSTHTSNDVESVLSGSLQITLIKNVKRNKPECNKTPRCTDLIIII